MLLGNYVGKSTPFYSFLTLQIHFTDRGYIVNRKSPSKSVFSHTREFSETTEGLLSSVKSDMSPQSGVTVRTRESPVRVRPR